MPGGRVRRKVPLDHHETSQGLGGSSDWAVWGDSTGVESICEFPGVFLTIEKIQPHLKVGVKKVVLSAPAKDDSHNVVWASGRTKLCPRKGWSPS